MWSGDISGINLNANENYGVVLLATRVATRSARRLDQPCTDPRLDLQPEHHSDALLRRSTATGGTLTSGLSFIHSYHASGSTPDVRSVVLGGGCGHPVNTVTDLASNAYFNVDTSPTAACGGITTYAVIDFGVTWEPNSLADMREGDRHELGDGGSRRRPPKS